MSKKERVHEDHASLKRSLYDAAPGAGDRVDMTVSGNPDVLEEARSYRKGGRVTPRGYFSDHHAYKLRGHR